jgi:hypothetical protein
MAKDHGGSPYIKARLVARQDHHENGCKASAAPNAKTSCELEATTTPQTGMSFSQCAPAFE